MKLRISFQPRKFYISLIIVFNVFFGCANNNEEIIAGGGSEPPLTTGEQVFSLEITPSVTSIAVGKSVQLLETVTNADGEVLLGESVAWSSSNEALATVSSTGRVLGISGGKATITAAVNEVIGIAQVTVSPTGGGLCTVQGASPPIPDIAMTSVASGFTLPVHVTHAGDGSRRLFVVEQRGTIRFLVGGSLQNEFFLDIRDRVAAGGEMGLLSIAFHPNFNSNGQFYVNYTADPPRRTVISKFTVGATLAETAASEQVLLEIPQPFSNHNGGQITFGSDGYLYIGMGDGGSGGDPLGNGQNLTTLLGAMLRIDIDRQDTGFLYAIPPDNPSWSGVSGARREIWAYGLRNPWRFSFDPLTGFLYLGDVGQSSREEIDIIRKGLNYGWNQVEGDICFLSNCVLSNFEPPLIAHMRSEMFAITGGLVYRGSEIPTLCGVYVYGDFGTGIVRGLRYDGTDIIEHRDLSSLSNPSSFGYDENHEVYALTFGDNTLYKVSAP